MIGFTTEQDGSIKVMCYLFTVSDDVHIGDLRQEPEDDNFWHFYPTAQCVLTARSCWTIGKQLSLLNGKLLSPKDSTGSHIVAQEE